MRQRSEPEHALALSEQWDQQQRPLMELTEPVRAPEPVADVVVPFLQSLAYGVAMAALTGVICSVFRLSGWYVLVAGAVVFALMLPQTLREARETLWRTATPVFPPTTRVNDEPPQTIRVELTQMENGSIRRMQIVDLPVDAERLRELVHGALRGESLAVHRWSGVGRPFTRTEYVQLTDQLTRIGWMTAPRGNVGRQLTAAGRVMLQKLCEQNERSER